MHDFARIFDGGGDPRPGNAVRHDLHKMLMIALPCMVCGGQACTDMELSGRSKEAFLRRFMKPEHGIPSHDAFSRLSGSSTRKACSGCWSALRRTGPGVWGRT